MSYMRSGTDTSTDYMSMWVTGRVPTDAAGTMETPVMVPAGTGQANYTGLRQPAPGRRPERHQRRPDRRHFWAANEFANTAGDGQLGHRRRQLPAQQRRPTRPTWRSRPPGRRPSQPGTNATYTITVTNNGPNAGDGRGPDRHPAGRLDLGVHDADGGDRTPSPRPVGRHGDRRRPRPHRRGQHRHLHPGRHRAARPGRRRRTSPTRRRSAARRPTRTRANNSATATGIDRRPARRPGRHRRRAGHRQRGRPDHLHRHRDEQRRDQSRHRRRADRHPGRQPAVTSPPRRARGRSASRAAW